MKFLMWAGTGLVALLWTLTIAVLASLANWLAGSTDQAIGSMQAVAQWPMPAWLGFWVDPDMLAPLKEMMVWAIDMLVVATPWLAPLLGWVAPVLWVLWALGMLLLLAIAAGAHWLMARKLGGPGSRASI